MSQQPGEEEETVGGERRCPLPPSFQSGQRLLDSLEQKGNGIRGPHVRGLVSKDKDRAISRSRRWRTEARAAKAGRSRGWVGTYQRSERGWWRCPGRPQRSAGVAWWRRDQTRGRSGSCPGRRALSVPSSSTSQSEPRALALRRPGTGAWRRPITTSGMNLSRCGGQFHPHTPRQRVRQPSSVLTQIRLGTDSHKRKVPRLLSSPAKRIVFLHQVLLHVEHNFPKQLFQCSFYF